MEVLNPTQQVQKIQSFNGEIIYVATVPIGSWNMDVYEGKSVDISELGLNVTNFRGIHGFVTSDAQDYMFVIPYFNPYASADPHLYFGLHSSNYINIFRKTGGFFHSVIFSNTLINRGYIFIFYVK